MGIVARRVVEVRIAGVALPVSVPSIDFAILLISIMIWLFGLFFLSRTVEMQKWIFKDAEDAPKPEAGKSTSFVISILIIGAWLLRNFIVIGRFEILDFFYKPNEYALGFLLASFFPMGVGLFKILTVVVVSLHPPRPSTKPFWIAFVYMLFGFINFAASVVTLVKVIRP